MYKATFVNQETCVYNEEVVPLYERIILPQILLLSCFASTIYSICNSICLYNSSIVQDIIIIIYRLLRFLLMVTKRLAI